MFGAFLKAPMPRSLYGRATLILLVPVLTILSVVSIVFIQRLYEDVTREMTRGVADEVALVMSRIEVSPSRETAMSNAQEVGLALGIGVSFGGDSIVDTREWIDLSGITVARTLRAELPGLQAIDLTDTDGSISVSHVSRHGLVALDLNRRRLSPRNPHQFLVLIGATSFFMTVIALLYLRGQVRPIRRLAAAASAFGKGRVVPYRPVGASEVLEAGQAFLEMRDRIERQIEQRTLMLSGVSHDLRTPLTRMRLALSLADETSETEAILQDIQEMEEMLDAFLSFAKTEASEQPTPQLVDEIVASALNRAKRAGYSIEIGEAPEKPISIRVRGAALERAIDNLIGNAARYANHARLSALEEEGRVRFVVEDDGPGIPEDRRQEAMQAFTRLDKARNQDGGSGVGLGLAIAADISRQHGGSLELGVSDALGGLRAELILPK